jgi:hypothetical protein
MIQTSDGIEEAFNPSGPDPSGAADRSRAEEPS